ncbi:MAG TPA: hypothetical protein VN778_01190 [Verrucomicrobiae bacterium]|nr:hypothetical protein [Verrucomicrobiae bacterium]
MSARNPYEHNDVVPEVDPQVTASFVNVVHMLTGVNLETRLKSYRIIDRADFTPLRICANLLGYANDDLIDDKVERSKAAVIERHSRTELWQHPEDKFRHYWNVVESVYINDLGEPTHQKSYWRRGLFGRLRIVDFDYQATESQVVEARDETIDAAMRAGLLAVNPERFFAGAPRPANQE